MKALVAIIVIYLILATSYSVLVPLGEAPDEVPHFQFMRYIGLNRALPAGSEAGSEGFQPPLYYAVGALLTGWIADDGFIVKANPDFSFDTSETSRHLLLHTSAESFPYHGAALAWHIGRLLSVLLGAITVIATFLIALELFPSKYALAIAAAGFNAFIPEFLFMSGAMNNDNAVGALSGMSLLVLLKLGKAKPSLRLSVVAGILIGLAIIAKTNALVFLPISALAAAGAAMRLDSWRTRIATFMGSMMVIGTIAVTVGGWWFWRNFVLHGDPLGWQLKLAISDVRQAPLNAQDFLWLATGLFQSFWGRFGGAAHIRMGNPMYPILGTITAVALVGLVIGAIRNVRRGTSWRERALSFSLVATLVILTFGALIRWTMTYLGTDQARLIYPILSVIAVLFARGLFQFLPARKPLIVAFVACFGLFAVLTPSYSILPNYYPGQVNQLPNSGNDLGEIDGKMELRGYQAVPDRAVGGNLNRLYLQWNVMSTINEDYWLKIQLLDKSGKIAYQKDSALTKGAFTSDTWRTGETIVSLHTLQPPMSLPAGAYSLRIGAYTFGSQKAVPVRNDAGEISDEYMSLGTIEIVTP